VEDIILSMEFTEREMGGSYEEIGIRAANWSYFDGCGLADYNSATR